VSGTLATCDLHYLLSFLVFLGDFILLPLLKGKVLELDHHAVCVNVPVLNFQLSDRFLRNLVRTITLDATAKLHQPPERNCRLEEGDGSFLRSTGINLSYKAKKPTRPPSEQHPPSKIENLAVYFISLFHRAYFT
jgi:hypothetical protein